MTDKDLEKIIKEAMTIETKPSVSSFSNVLSKLADEEIVTKSYGIRYSIQTAMSKIINNKLSKTFGEWKSNRIIILVPTFILLFFIGAFSLSPSEAQTSKAILKLAEQDVTTEEQYISDEDQILDNMMFETPAINDLSILQNEI